MTFQTISPRCDMAHTSTVAQICVSVEAEGFQRFQVSSNGVCQRFCRPWVIRCPNRWHENGITWLHWCSSIPLLKQIQSEPHLLSDRVVGVGQDLGQINHHKQWKMWLSDAKESRQSATYHTIIYESRSLYESNLKQKKHLFISSRGRTTRIFSYIFQWHPLGCQTKNVRWSSRPTLPAPAGAVFKKPKETSLLVWYMDVSENGWFSPQIIPF